jgi:hypothetical protein
MNDYIHSLIERYGRKGLIFDANILLLFVVGSANRSAVGRRKRTKQYTPEDFDLLFNLSRLFHNRLLTTPNILTEVSNLLGEEASGKESQFFDEFANRLETIEEKYLPSREISQTSVFPRLGLTDAGIIELVNEKHLVVTDDTMLFAHIAQAGVDVLNFNHLRESSFLS